MLKFGVIALLLVYLPTTAATSCEACKTAYDADKTSAGSDNAALCTALAAYLTCLEGSANGDTECPPSATDAGQIQSDFTDASCSTVAAFTDTCICQKDFWKTDQRTDGATAVCRASKAYIACLKGKTDEACDSSATVVALATGVEARITNLGSTACAITTACQCEINAAKADISTDTIKCTTYKAQYACLYTLNTVPCVSTTAIDDLKTAAATSVTSTTSCTFDDTCICQRAFDAAPQSNDAEKCTAGSTRDRVLYFQFDNNECHPIMTALTATCQCEVDAAKGDASTSAKFCTVLTTLKTCLSTISTPTEDGCDDTTQSDIVADTDLEITGAMCGSAVDHVTFAMTSLVISVLVSMFL